jgi:hydrogenase-4 component F
LLPLVLAPLPFALLCLALPASLLRRLSLVAGALTHFVLVTQCWQLPVGDRQIDALGMLFITLISLLFLATSIYFVGYHQKALLSQRVFLACLLLLLASLTLVCATQHLGVLWVALETASLAATPLIYFRLGPRALEATWKFVLMNSVGIALALVGIFCVGLATTPAPQAFPLTVNALIAHATQLDLTWLRAGFLLAMVGFGTKMGLAPMHSWKPDAYGEAPPPVAAILAGAMTLGAFISILRIYQVCVAAGQGSFAGMWMIVFGLLSIATAAVFIVGNNDYRRILAYTSVEHMGVLVLGTGLGTLGQQASMLHALHNTINKGVLFFVAGFLWRIYRTNRISDIRGTLHQHPVAGVMLLAGLCATTGLPPFGMFFSEFGILLAAIQQSQWLVAALFVVTLAIVFVGVMTAMLPMAFGQPPDSPTDPAADNPGWRWRKPVMLLPAGALVLLALSLGAYQPPFVRSALHDAAQCLNPAPPSQSIAAMQPREVVP